MNQELKRLAQNARNRLISKGNRSGVKKMNAPLSPNVKFKIITSSEADENFNNKAREVLSKDTIDPIKELMDMNYYRSLDACNKERYLLSVIEKYSRFKEKFEHSLEQKLVY